MKPHLLYLSVIIILVIALFFRGCDKPDSKVAEFDHVKKALDLKSDSLQKVGKKIAVREQNLKLQEIKTDSAYKAAVRSYRNTKITIKDLPCDSAIKIVLQDCDTLESNCSQEIAVLKELGTVKDSIIDNLTAVVQVDSMYKSVLVAEIETLQPRQTFYIGCDATTNGNIYPSIGFDTRKWVFNAGYDPFNKSVKAGVYFKIRGWKRR